MAPLDFLYVSFLFDAAPVPAGARIAFASPIGKYFNLFHDSDSGIRAGILFPDFGL